ncbi:MAG TPA: von Willebrand factor type A domain-containing protein, partial [Chitinophagaceae bacterium]|nr:von Willebrand factor type A domain-containing protein [Chitinophagaceae bacterium]
AGVTVQVKRTKIATVTNVKGEFTITALDEKAVLVISYIGFDSKEIKIKDIQNIVVALKPTAQHSEVLDSAKLTQDYDAVFLSPVMESKARITASGYYNYNPSELLKDHEGSDDSWRYNNNFNTEGYDKVTENPFLKVNDNPLSTFSIDVDAASYSNMRRFINDGQLPPPGAIRIEELINYFTYQYPQPKNDDPFTVNMELSSCPWNEKHELVLIGLQGKKIPVDNLPASNLVFLIDVSGSMDEPDKLPLVKSSLKLLVDQLRPQDKVALVVYAGNAGLVLPSRSGEEKIKIKNAIDQLEAGGSTAGGAGIQLAYKIAKENFVKDGNNRVILCTDGDFNVGLSSDDALENLIEEERKSGVFLTVLGFGTGNYQDSKMQKLADKGNGNHAYIDGISEAKKVLINEFGGTLFTIAKDVKLQIEFNSDKVKAYRLIGYENRMLAKEDFNNDKKEAGELGSGHTVTALYEIIPTGVNDESLDSVDALKYQKIKKVKLTNVYTNELMNVKLRYKRPNSLTFIKSSVELIDDTNSQNSETSKMIQFPLIDKPVELAQTSNNFRFAAAVAEFGMLLRNSQYRGNGDFNLVKQLAKNAIGNDEEGYRKEFVHLVENAAILKGKKDTVKE